jgi:UDP-2,3-diacylglucosamine hydrolase
VPTFFASDVHLRPDRPDRGQRFGRWVDQLSGRDRLYLAGDICDFWFATRSRSADVRACPGLNGLARFVRRGGDLIVMPGNHDAWMGAIYQDHLGAQYVDAPLLEVVEHGLRIHLVHGHWLGGRPFWKGAMESRAFFRAFRALPGPIASALSWALDRTNDASLEASNRRHLAVFRRYADALEGRADLAVFGHTHQTVDDPSRRPRLIVLGDWIVRNSFLRVDEEGARLVILDNEALVSP